MTIFYSCHSVQHFSMVKNIYKGSFLFLKSLVKNLYKLFKSHASFGAVLNMRLFKRTLKLHASQSVQIKLEKS